MQVILDIPDKVYNEIMDMCSYNDIVFDDYALDCILDNFNLMKYSDLNEKLGIVKEQKVEPPKVEEKPNEVIEKKKVGRPKKKKVEPPIELPKIEEKIVEEETPKITKRTRILKTK